MTPPLRVRRLGPGDEALLAELAARDADYDLDDRGAPLLPLAPTDAAAYLADPSVLHWVALDDGGVLGHLFCHQLRLRGGEGRELVLYEIGVHRAARRRGVGRALLDAMRDWMRAHAVRTCWVLADNPGAARFYQACGYVIEQPEPTYLILELSD